MLKGGKKGKFKGKKFVLTKEAKKVFEKLMWLFTIALILVHYDLTRRIMVESDASSFAILAVISQLLEATGQWHPVAFWLQKMQPAKKNYGISKSEILAIVEACKYWQHYLKGTTYKVRVISDYCNLRMFFTRKNLTCCEAKWWKRLFKLDMEIEYCPRKKNLADGSSWHLDYMDAADNKEKKTLHIVGYVT